ncbi:MAG TPA: Na/Pi symporter [Kiritimatiellia bacterium]|nr:Na/Pi symporter [Kiritimatiellia bacterium]
MTGSDIFFLSATVLGGLALFIFGMNIMTEGLRLAAGSGLRAIFNKATSNRFTGVGLGTFLGLLIHSSGTSVMLVGFVNAGLITLIQAIPVIVGTNIGTTLSMQAISFRLGDFAFFMIALGFIIKMAAPRPRLKDFGHAFLGFGLLFLGMNIMGDAIKPYRAELAPLLSGISAETFSGLFLGILLATAITLVIQSSGATIGMSFAMIQAGVFTSLEQTFPIILGAHIGTCITALLASIGANIQARRVAFSHLYFNLFNVAIAILAKGLFLTLIPMTSSSVLRQTANLHTAVMVAAAIMVIPFIPAFARLLTSTIRSNKPEPTPSFLDDRLQEYPEKALEACIRELQRVARICSRSLMISAETILFSYDRRKILEIKLNEKVVDEVKLSMKDYLCTLTENYLSKRQAILLQHIDRCMIDLERIGDHIDSICDLSLRRQKIPEALVDKESLDQLFDLYARALRVFRAVIESLNPDLENFQEVAEKILRLRNEYVAFSANIKIYYTDKVSAKVMTPIAGFYFSEYIASLDRIVKHSKSIALAERQPQFWIKHKKLDKHAVKAPDIHAPSLVDPRDYISRLQEENQI